MLCATNSWQPISKHYKPIKHFSRVFKVETSFMNAEIY